MANNFTLGGVFNSNANASGSAPSTPAGQYVEDWTYDSNTGVVTVTFGDNSVTTFTIEASGDTPITGGDPVVSVTFNNPTLQIALESGLSFDVDLSSINTDTNNYVDGASFDSNILTLNRLDLDDLTVDLSSLIQTADIVTNDLTYTAQFEQVVLTIADNQVVLSSAAQPPNLPMPPGNPDDVNALDDNVVDFGGVTLPDGTTLTDTNVNNIVATDLDGNPVDITTPTPDDEDGSFSLNVPAGTDTVDVDVTYAGTYSNGDPYTEEVDLEVDTFIPYFTFHTPPQTLTNLAIPNDVSVESGAAIGSGTSFSITTTETRRRWLAAETSGLTFMNQGFPVAATELSDTITVAAGSLSITYYQYDFGVALAGTLNVTVN